MYEQDLCRETATSSSFEVNASVRWYLESVDVHCYHKGKKIGVFMHVLHCFFGVISLHECLTNLDIFWVWTYSQFFFFEPSQIISGTFEWPNICHRLAALNNSVAIVQRINEEIISLRLDPEEGYWAIMSVSILQTESREQDKQVICLILKGHNNRTTSTSPQQRIWRGEELPRASMEVKISAR